MQQTDTALRYLLRNRARPTFLSRSWWKSWAKRALHFPQLVRLMIQRRRLHARGAKIASSALLSGTHIEGRAANLSVGNFSGIGRAVLQCHAPIVVGDNVVINDGAKILTGSHDIHSPHYDHVFKPVNIGDYVWVASDAIILQGVTLGRCCVVGAGAVVSKSVEPYQVVAGNPAAPKGQRKAVGFHYKPSTWHSLYGAWLGRDGGNSAKQTHGLEAHP
jgi:acetyltransferase-like isoleucine patch superfamily enzyme